MSSNVSVLFYALNSTDRHYFFYCLVVAAWRMANFQAPGGFLGNAPILHLNKKTHIGT